MSAVSAPSRARSSRTPSPCARSGSAIALASVSTSGGFRKLVSIPYSRAGTGSPFRPGSRRGKSVVNRGRFAALAPRQP